METCMVPYRKIGKSSKKSGLWYHLCCCNNDEVEDFCDSSEKQTCPFRFLGQYVGSCKCAFRNVTGSDFGLISLNYFSQNILSQNQL